MAGRPYRALGGGFALSCPGPRVGRRACRSAVGCDRPAAALAVVCRCPARRRGSCPCSAGSRRVHERGGPRWPLTGMPTQGRRTSVTAGRSAATESQRQPRAGCAESRQLQRPLSGNRGPAAPRAGSSHGRQLPRPAAPRQHQRRRCSRPARGPTARDWMAERPKPRCFRQVEDVHLVRSHRTGGVCAPERDT